MAERKFLGGFTIIGTNNKTASEMTDEELDALADSLFDQIESAVAENEEGGNG